MRVLRSIAATSTLVLALGGAVLAAPVAQADTGADTASTATVERYDGAIRYRAAAGQVNDLRISTKAIDVDPDEFGGDYLVTFRDKFEITITTGRVHVPLGDRPHRRRVRGARAPGVRRLGHLRRRPR